MVLLICLIAVRFVSCIVPRASRARWRRAWSSQIWHYHSLLRSRGVQSRYVRARTWHHFIGAARDARRLFLHTPSMRRIRLAMRRPEFCLATIAFLLASVVVLSRGLAITRAMIAPHYPDAGSLVLISEHNVLLDERHQIPVELLEYWKRHNTTFTGLAGYQWNSHGTAWVTAEFFDVLGARPQRFLLHPVTEWRPLGGQHYLGVLGRLKPGVAPETAVAELRDLADRYRDFQRPAPTAQVMPLLDRVRQPLYTYAFVCALTSLLLLAAAGIGIRADLRRSGRIRGRYWTFFCAKSAMLPMALAMVIWEFSRATSFSLTGGPTFVAEPIFVWLVILASGGIVWWCLADQRVRCRACLQTLQYPVRIGSLGAVLFDHAGVELMCCEGHGALYVPAVSSDYVQRGGWTALDSVVHG